MKWLVVTVAALLLKLILDELLDWCPWVAERVIRRAAVQLPEDMRDRYSHEWLAELDAVPGKGLSKLLFAFRVLWSADAVANAAGGGGIPRRSQLGLRLLDLQFSVFALVYLAPLLGLITLAIWIKEGRPVFIRQYHVEGGRIVGSKLTFRTFRRPRHWSEVGIGESVFASTIGRWLERHTLDELPGLVDVLRGEMTLFGPPASAATKVAGLKPGLVDWRIAFEGPDALGTPRDPRMDPDWAVQWTVAHALRALFLTAWYALRDADAHR